MTERKYNPDDYPHPGEVLLTELEEIGISQRAFAHFISYNKDDLVSVCAGSLNVSPTLACKLGRALGTPPRKWLELQMHHDLARVDTREYEDIRQLGAPLEGEEEGE